MKNFFLNKNNLNFYHIIYKNESIKLFDNLVPDSEVPALEPPQHKRFLTSLKTIVGNASAKMKKGLYKFSDWLMNYVSPKTKATVSNSIQKILNLFPKITIKAKLFKTVFKALRNLMR